MTLAHSSRSTVEIELVETSIDGVVWRVHIVSRTRCASIQAALKVIKQFGIPGSSYEVVRSAVTVDVLKRFDEVVEA